jgi:hypothetical protein
MKHYVKIATIKNLNLGKLINKIFAYIKKKYYLCNVKMKHYQLWQRKDTLPKKDIPFIGIVTAFVFAQQEIAQKTM